MTSPPLDTSQASSCLASVTKPTLKLGCNAPLSGTAHKVVMTSEITSSPIRKKSPGPDASPSTVIIEPTRGWAALGLRDVWEYRELLYFLIWREVKGRYRQTALGPLWIVLQPLASMVIFSLIFGQLARLPSEGMPYPIFTYVALLPWQFFAIGARQSAGSLLQQQSVITKVYFPRLVVPISSVLSALVDFLASFAVLIGMILFYRVRLTWEILTLPLFLLLAATMALGVGLWLAGLAVKFRDVAIALGFGITAWQYLTPVAYSATLIPERWRLLYRLNPVTSVIEGFRWAVLGTGQPPDWITLVNAGTALLLLVTGAFYFRRTERTIVDVI
jgi:lipopolysaccharide transport system permease protein